MKSSSGPRKPSAGLGDLAPGGEVVERVAAVVEGDDLGQLLEEQAERPPDRDDVDGHVELVEDQDAGVEGGVGSEAHGRGSPVGVGTSRRGLGGNSAIGSPLPADAGGVGGIRAGLNRLTLPASEGLADGPADFGRASRRRRGRGSGACRRRAPSPRPCGSRSAPLRAPQVVEQHRHREDRGDRVGDPLAGDVGCRAVDRLEHARGRLLRVQVRRGGQAHPALEHGAQVGDDVAEHVRRGDHVVSLGRRDHPHAAGVDVVVVGLDLGIVTRDFGEGPHPEVVRVGQDVRLGDHRHQADEAPLPVVGARGRGRAWPCRAICARSKAKRRQRSTPARVLIEVWIATSSDVPLRVNPPAPT